MLVAAMVNASSPARASPFTVVIDPGHGGSNTGAAGRAPGRWEKQVTLGIARALKARLEREGLRVVLTRDGDEYLTLRERARRANAAHPDCFISLHTNASPDHGRHGIETYVLERGSADVDARRAAARAADSLDGLLGELRQLDAHRSSMVLARAVQSRLVHAAPNRDRGVKQAAYDVLDGIDAAAILVEVGFIDHPIEGVRLLDPEQQARIADALADGVFDFIAARRPRLAAR